MNDIYPYNFQRVQRLLDQYIRNPNFPSIILATNDLCLTKDGTLNFHNGHLWTKENSHDIYLSRFQQWLSTNNSAVIVNSIQIVLYEMPASLNEESYLTFLQYELPGLLDDVTINLPRIMSDDFSASFFGTIRNYLSTIFP